MTDSRDAYFTRVAPAWDAMRAAFFSDAVREKAFRMSGVARGDLAADIGCGTGFITEGLVRLGARVIAVDASPAMLAEMKKKYLSPAPVVIVAGRGEQVPLGDAMVRRVFANMYLHHAGDPAGAIREMARILEPGGTLAITDLDTHAHEFLRTEHQDRWMGFRREDVRDWCARAGLDRIAVECSGEECVAGTARVGIFITVASRPAGGS